MDNPQNNRFVTDYLAAHNYMPATYAAQAYDAAMLLDSAIRKVGGNLVGQGRRCARRSRRPISARCAAPFSFGVNHYPVQDFWLLKVGRRADGKFGDADRAQGA